MLRGAAKDPQLITSSWHRPQDLIAGVVVREVLNVPGDRGVLTEIFRAEWDPAGAPVAQVFQVRLFPGAISAWHCHLKATDRLFVGGGHARLALYDARDGSPSRGRINEFHLGESRPALVVVPPGVWHGVQNVGGVPACVVNAPTVAYDYEDPDHYRVPPDSAEIPYAWSRRPDGAM